MRVIDALLVEIEHNEADLTSWAPGFGEFTSGEIKAVAMSVNVGEAARVHQTHHLLQKLGACGTLILNFTTGSLTRQQMTSSIRLRCCTEIEPLGEEQSWQDACVGLTVSFAASFHCFELC